MEHFVINERVTSFRLAKSFAAGARRIGIALGVAALCGIALVSSNTAAADARVARPMLMRAAVVQGTEKEVCKVYADAIEQTVFNNYPHCGRWSVPQRGGLSAVVAVPLTMQEYEAVFDSMSGFYSAGNPAGQSKEAAKNKEMLIDRYRDWHSKSFATEPRLGVELIVNPRPSSWLLAPVGKGERLLLMEQNSSDCGHELDSGFIGQSQIDLFVVRQDGAVDSERTAALLAGASLLPGKPTNKSPVVKLSSLVGHSFGAFGFGNSIFVDTFEGLPTKGGSPGSNHYAGTLLVYSLAINKPSLDLVCKISVEERVKPWRFIR